MCFRNCQQANSSTGQGEHATSAGLGHLLRQCLRRQWVSRIDHTKNSQQAVPSAGGKAFLGRVWPAGSQNHPRVERQRAVGTPSPERSSPQVVCPRESENSIRERDTGRIRLERQPLSHRFKMRLQKVFPVAKARTKRTAELLRSGLIPCVMPA